MGRKFDFGGWATKNNLRCSDGRTIRKDAFKNNDGKTVPLVWQHQHNDPTNVLGHALLENREEGVYAYCTFNDTPNGQHAKALVEHGDVAALSIYANQLQQRGGDVLHGEIREVSIVLAGANPGATIDFATLAHADGSEEELEDEATIYTGEDIELSHADDAEEGDDMAKTEKGETVKDIFDSLTDKQKNAVYFMIGQVLEEHGIKPDDKKEEVNHSDDEGEEDTMKYNVFDRETAGAQGVLSHADFAKITADGKRLGSLKAAVEEHLENGVLAHANGVETANGTQYNPATGEAGAYTYGFNSPDMLFPDARAIQETPEWIKRDTGWVAKVLNAAHHTPFSRVKSLFANITADEARAKGYLKGHQKTEEVFSLLKRTTDSQTVYKKQKLDRDDVIDITGFDVVAWIKGEMRLMLDEELARAALVGDGRLSSSDDKISEDHIRPIYNDNDLFTIKCQVTVAANATDDDKAKAAIRQIIKSRKDYKGSGRPTLFTTEDALTDMLLLEDSIGHTLYADEAALARKLRVSEIVTVPVMENITDQTRGTLLGVIVNMTDYNFGADKGGAVNLFDDFDIDYNQQKYLIETRCSGALTKPYSAIAVWIKTAA